MEAAHAPFLRSSTRHLSSGSRSEVIERLARVAPREAARLRGCGLRLYGETRCSSRWCVVCDGIDRRRFLRRADRRLREARAERPHGRVVLLTLTAPSTDARAGLARLQRGVRKLRRLRSWCARFEAGVLEVEPTRSGSRTRWLVHSHAVLLLDDGDTIAELRAAWARSWARSGFGALDLRTWRRSREWRGQHHGGLAYAVKPWRAGAPTGLDDERLRELVGALRRRRARWLLGGRRRRGPRELDRVAPRAADDRGVAEAAPLR